MSKPKCLCLDSGIFNNTANGVSTAITMAPGDVISASFKSKTRVVSLQIWPLSKYAATMIPYVFELTPSTSSGTFTFRYHSTKKTFSAASGLSGHDVWTFQQALPFTFELSGIPSLADGFEVVNVTLSNQSGKTPASTNGVDCFFNQVDGTSATPSDIQVACSSCTEDNILNGCLDFNIKAFSLTDAAIAVGLFILVTLVIKRFI